MMSETDEAIEMMQCGTTSGPNFRTAAAAARKIPSSRSVTSDHSASGSHRGRGVWSSPMSSSIRSLSSSAE